MQNSFEKKINQTVQKWLPTQNQSEAPLSVEKAVACYMLRPAQTVHEEVDAAIELLGDLRGVYGEYEQLQVKANIALYDFLQGVFSVIVRMNVQRKDRKGAELGRLRTAFETTIAQLKKQDQISFTAGTSFEAKVLRFVCGDITKSREKAWVRVLKIALANKDLTSGNTFFATWLAAEGGVYEVANTNKDGMKPSERHQANVEEGLKFVDSWLGTEEHQQLKNKFACEPNLRDDQFRGLSVALIRYDNEGEPELVFEHGEEKTIEYMLAIIGKAQDEPVRDRAEVLAEEAAKMKAFTDITGFPVEMHRE
ncbi:MULTISPECIES: hypothetical protein [unclassified Ruegeria]|uniref:hypothetical protein n=1 Tax=unclassified Ruegeria TaxID=2625375 RepID=UPI001489CC7C|nr:MULTISPECIES: hypothetical protein [unclassified Ruegeria]